MVLRVGGMTRVVWAGPEPDLAGSAEETHERADLPAAAPAKVTNDTG